MNKLTLPFDKVYLINLVEHQERLHDMLDQFDYLEIRDKVEIHQTCTHPHEEIIMDAFHQSKQGLFNVPRAVSCTREHYTIIKCAYLSGMNSIMIIEDDCQFLNKIDILQQYFDNLPNDWDVLRINCLRGSTEERHFKDKDTLWDRQFIGIWGSGCYALSRKAMKEIIESLDSFYEPIDCPLYYYGNYDLNQYIPKIPLGISKIDGFASISSETYSTYNPLYYYFDIDELNLHDYGVNHKNLVYFISHIVSMETIRRYGQLKKGLPKNYDIKWVVPSNVDKEMLRQFKIDYITFDNQIIFNTGTSQLNVGAIIQQFYDERRLMKYDFYWIVEYDVLFNGEWSTFFHQVETKCPDADFVGAYIQKKRPEVAWQHFIEDNPSYHDQLKSCVSVCRLSNRALKYICKEASFFKGKTIYEMYWPTICYAHHLTIKSISDEETDEEFKSDLHFCKIQNYSMNLCTTDKSVMTEKNMLYTRIK